MNEDNLLDEINSTFLFRLGFRHAYENYKDQADWFLKVSHTFFA